MSSLFALTKNFNLNFKITLLQYLSRAVNGQYIYILSRSDHKVVCPDKLVEPISLQTECAEISA